jgi:hypothetical protein
MGRNDLCGKSCDSVGSQASLSGLSSWANAPLLDISFWEQLSKQKLPRENTKGPVKLLLQNGGTKQLFSQPRNLVLKKLKGRLRGIRKKHFLRRSIRLAQVVESKRRDHALRLRRCLKTTLKFQSSTGMFRYRYTPGIKEIARVLSFPLLTLALIPGFSVLCRPVVKQEREQVFTPESFHELGLHPHLVSIP